MDADLETPAGRQALQILNTMLEEGTPAPTDFENIVISISKPGRDPIDLSNRRGITLSTAFLKLIMTILEDRMSTALNGENFFTPDQGGFRRLEEGMGQFLSLTEVVRRRANDNKPTYVLYIDFQKAFPSVPHEALWKKLRHIGIPENIIKFLDTTYKGSTFRMRVGDELSDNYPMEIGTKEGCPLSPLLFIIFVNDLFKKLPGVIVPGITKGQKYNDTGKLYADDAAAFFDNLEDLEKGCRIITEWVDKWKTLKIGHAKCAVVMHGEKDPELRKAFLEKYGAPSQYPSDNKSHFTLTDGKVYAQSSYKYLGIDIGDNLGVGYDAELTYTTTVANKVQQKVGQYACILKDPRRTLAEKAFLIKTYILSAALYGGEWIGMNQTRTSIIQKQVDHALYLSIGEKWACNSICPVRLSWELGVPSVAAACAAAR
jgi:hypothetical protein